MSSLAGRFMKKNNYIHTKNDNEQQDMPEFWRSLEEYSQTPEFQRWVENEFPSGIFQKSNELRRRRFLQIMASTLAMTGLQSCTQPPEDIVPFSHEPQNEAPGIPEFYASGIRHHQGFVQGVLVESHEGRPTKIEGNPQHPSSLGATDVLTQASILNLYDPDRSQSALHNGKHSSWDYFLSESRGWLQSYRNNGGKGLRLLTSPITSPSLLKQIEQWKKAMPNAKWHQYSPIGWEAVEESARIAFGEDLNPIYHFDKADVVVSLDSDFFSELPGCVRYAKEFSQLRNVLREPNPEKMNRFYAFEPTPSMTGSNADHRYPVNSSEMQDVVLLLLSELNRDMDLPFPIPEFTSQLEDDVEKGIKVMAKDLLAHQGRSLVIAGIFQPAWIQALVFFINHKLGNISKTLDFADDPVKRMGLNPGTISELVHDIHNQNAETLIIVGCNPVYNAPSDFNFVDSLKQIKRKIHFGLYTDETAQQCQWHFPLHHDLESWSDGIAFDGTRSIIQPLIAPLYSSHSPYELIQLLMGGFIQTDYDIVRSFWRRQFAADDRSEISEFEEWWKDKIESGVMPSAYEGEEKRQVSVQPARLQEVIQANVKGNSKQNKSRTNIELLIKPDSRIGDGSYSNNSWLQEMPRHIYQLTWDNALLINPETASRLNLVQDHVVKLKHEDQEIKVPVMLLPGQAQNTVTLHLGYGRTAAGHVGNGIGVNVYPLRTSEMPWHIPSVELEATSERYPLARTQNHHVMEGDRFIETATNEEYKKNPKAIISKEKEMPSLYPEYDYRKGEQWGMTIDLTACIGCGACTIACQAENNIPVVGKEEVLNSREMHWIRVDHYYRGPANKPEIHTQPVPCMQCEKAPCEIVCPVGATQHSTDGLNEMIYNRCIGTRYCSNNCPYKVRRFNFYNYTDLAEILKLQRNSDVTVRGRGVMEKCTYCVQRIRRTQINAQIDNRAIRDGEIVTACQQVCPAQAIEFGDLNKQDSKIKRSKQHPLNYGAPHKNLCTSFGSGRFPSPWYRARM
ncbi:MAG: 4Fe-4S dicluster domain-containing protein [bacterium]|nr:4Fe-4S dicluster domain-containing protein [bacterium]